MGPKRAGRAGGGESSRVVLAGGGSAGHVNPLLATAAQLQKEGLQPEVLGTKEGLEADLVPAAGLKLTVVPKVPLPRRPSWQFFSIPRRLLSAVKIARSRIRGAGAVVGYGGYVSVPAYLAARRLGVPVVIHEQNARPGLANRLGARFARAVGLTFPGTPLVARRGVTEVVGLPLRPQIAQLVGERRDAAGARNARERGATALGLDPDLTTLLVTGGSLGAEHLNRVLLESLAYLPEDVQVLHLTGRGKDQPVREALRSASAGVAERWITLDYLSEMEDALAVADLVVCRSGAGTVAELMALGLPAVYVPLPIGNGEQRLNAADVVDHGGAYLVPDAEFTVDTVRELVYPTLTDPAQLERMSERARLSSVGDGSAKLVELVKGAMNR